MSLIFPRQENVQDSCTVLKIKEIPKFFEACILSLFHRLFFYNTESILLILFCLKNPVEENKFIELKNTGGKTYEACLYPFIEG